MKKTIIFGLLLLAVVFISGCEKGDISKISDEDLGRTTGKVIVCNKPYILVGTSCCLDKDDNSICDSDEREEVKQELEEKTTTTTLPQEEEKIDIEEEQKKICKNKCGDVCEFQKLKLESYTYSVKDGCDCKCKEEKAETTTSTYDLANFPAGFIKDGKVDGIIIVNDDLFDDAEVQGAILQLSGSVSQRPGDNLKIPIKLANIDVYTSVNQNAIIIGTPCETDIGMEVMPESDPFDCSDNFKTGEGRIISKITSDNKIKILVAGGSNSDTAKAVNYLVTYWEQNLKGSELIVK